MVDNQHKQIKGYRDLSPAEIAMMNQAKEFQTRILALHAELNAQLLSYKKSIANNISMFDDTNPAKWQWQEEMERFNNAEPFRWLAIAKTDIQTGFMALIRAIAQPGV